MEQNKSEQRGSNRTSSAVPITPKVLGSDVELGNFIQGWPDSLAKSDFLASRSMLREVDGIPNTQSRIYGGSSVYWNQAHSQDWGRKYLASNGGCIYVDLNHLELCTPETRSAHDYVAAWHAMLKIAQRAQSDANAQLPDGQRIFASVNNSDRQGSSWGAHVNLLIGRDLFNQLCVQQTDGPLSFLTAYQCSSIVFTGAGKCGSENGQPSVPFQISQRADFFETLTGEQTTQRRPLVNTRNEPLCGHRFGLRVTPPADQFARLHCIFFDATLAHVSTYLKVGVLQIIGAMCEAGCVDASLALADPLAAVVQWSHDPDLTARARLRTGKRLTAVEHQLEFLERAAAFVDQGHCMDCVPDAQAIVTLWEDTLLKLQRRDWGALMPRLDWVAKRLVIERAVTNGGMHWESADARHMDVLFSSLCCDEGIFWSLDAAGLIDRIVDDAEIQALVDNPPEDTRAWTRTMLLRRAGANNIDKIDWDHVRLRVGGDRVSPTYRTVVLPNPCGHTRSECEPAFTVDTDLSTLIDALGAREEEYYPGLSTQFLVTDEGVTIIN